jgi:hypothetical protein
MDGSARYSRRKRARIPVAALAPPSVRLRLVGATFARCTAPPTLHPPSAWLGEYRTSSVCAGAIQLKVRLATRLDAHGQSLGSRLGFTGLQGCRAVGLVTHRSVPRSRVRMASGAPTDNQYVVGSPSVARRAPEVRMGLRLRAHAGLQTLTHMATRLLGLPV